MAVTHGDLTLRKKREGLEVTNQRGLLLMVFSILCGFASFILCLAAEATRSEATWFVMTKDKKEKAYECYYSSNGRTPLTCAGLGFLALAAAMLIEHAFILLIISGPRPPMLVAWSLRDEADPPASAARLKWEACTLFLATWVSFAVAEVLLMIGISVEASHLTNWSSLKANCVIARPGLFAAAGVFGLATVFLAAALYLTALRAQRLHQRQQQHGNTRSHQNPQHVSNSAPSAPPPTAPLHSDQQTTHMIGANQSGRMESAHAHLSKS